MSQNPQPIPYGSIIHLENGAKDGGYLGASRSLIEEDVIKWQDPAVLSFVFTHLFENRAGSGSWEILPDPNNPQVKIGDTVKYGDNIRLRNVHNQAGYLDLFDWVHILGDSLDEYKNDMQNGVFTIDSMLRPPPDNVPSAEWTIVSAAGDTKGDIHAGAAIHLESTWLKPYLNRGLLNSDKTITETRLTTHKRLRDNLHYTEEEYDGERMFVFVGSDSGHDGSTRWTITLSDSSQDFYYLWGEEDGRWVDYGSLKSENRRQIGCSQDRYRSSGAGD